MAHRTHRFARRSSLAVSLAALSASVGCTPSKTINVRSTPDGATLLLYRVPPQGPEVPVPLDPDQSRTPTSLSLEFQPDVHYRIEAHRVLCAPSADTTVRLEPQSETDFTIKLTQFKQFADGLVYAAARAGDLWQMKANPTQTTATIDTSEPNPVYIDQPVPVTDNQLGTVDFPSFAVTAGPAGPLMVYERSQRDSSIPGGLDSKLFKLPLAAGMNATMLTLNRRQQHNPAFSYDGADVIFDTNDDSRTRSPMQFKTDSDESTVTRVPHDADTCETEFSAGREFLAFTAYAPNTPEPQVMVSALDGSGPTSRGGGMSPQIGPDQNFIAFVHRPESGGHLRLGLVNLRGPITTRDLQLDTDHDVTEPHWSPDGKLIAYCSNLRDGRPVDEGREANPKFREGEETHAFLWVVTADGRNALQLTHGENFDAHPVFDPNGRTIYFRSNRGGTWNIWKCNLTDAAMAKLGVR